MTSAQDERMQKCVFPQWRVYVVADVWQLAAIPATMLFDTIIERCTYVAVQHLYGFLCC